MCNMSIVGSKMDILRDIRETLRKNIQAVDFLFQLQDKFFRILYAVIGDIEKNMFKVILRIVGNVNFIFLCHA